jgi:SpoVK/Ycf46/Vps4 family AAA+-type ATPase
MALDLNSFLQKFGNISLDDEKFSFVDPDILSDFLEHVLDDSSNTTSWDEIIGLNFAKMALQEIIMMPMLRPDLFFGLREPPRGILLFGPPSTEKCK